MPHKSRQSGLLPVQVGFNSALGGKHLSILTSSLPLHQSPATVDDPLSLVSKGNLPGEPGVWMFGVHNVDHLTVPGTKANAMYSVKTFTLRYQTKLGICCQDFAE